MKNNTSNFTQEIVLPSKGFLNPEIPEGKLTQRCMMVQDQKFLAGSNQGARSALHQVIQRTITSPEGFDVSNLTLADTMYLLFKLRILSYGSHYKFRTKCPECGKKIELSVDLSELPVQTLEEGYADSQIVKLPHRGDTVYTKLLTNRDLDEIANEVKRRKKRNPDDDSEYILRIVQSIEKIYLVGDKKDITHPIDIENYVNSLTDFDASTIIYARDSAEFGINPVVECLCPECRNYIDVSVQFSGDFFRPYSSR